MNQTNLLTLAISILLFLGCQSVSSDATVEKLEIEPQPLKKESLPPTLWSPEARRIHASFLYLVGEYEALKGHFKSSKKLFERAYNLDSNQFLAQKMLTVKALSGQIDEALLQAKRLVLLYPKDMALATIFAKLLTQSGNYQEAIRQFEHIIDQDPEEMEAYLGLIEIYRFQKRKAEAIVIAKEMVRLNPTSTKGWVLLAKLYLSSSQPEKALAAARSAHQLSGGDIEKTMIYAIALELNKKTKEAVRLYEKLLRVYPTNEELISKMVKIYREMGDLEDALALLEEASQGPNPTPGIIMQQAFILWELKRFDEAAKKLKEIAKAHPESERAQYFSALGDEKIGNHHRALSIYQRIQESSSFYIQANIRMIIIYEQQKNIDKAIKIVHKMVQLSGDQANIFFELGARVLAGSKRYKEAINILTQGISRFPKKADFLFLQGVYYEKIGQKDKCIEKMKATIKKDPNNSMAYNYLGYLYAEDGENLDEAKNLIQKALEIKPNDGFYQDSLGWVYFRQGHLDKALKTLHQALRLIPNEGVVMEHIGDVYSTKEEYAKAASFYNRALKGRLEEKDKKRIQCKVNKMSVTDEKEFQNSSFSFDYSICH